MKKICILGKGYIGEHLYNYLIKKVNFNLQIDLFSIRKLKNLDIRNYDVIIDTADRSSGIHDDLIQEKLKIIRGENNDYVLYIYLSSISIYDTKINKIDEQSKIKLENQYQLNKLKNEELICQNKKNNKILRLSNIWGIDSPKGTFIGDQIFNLKNGIPLEINENDFESYIDLVHFRDLSRLIFSIIISKTTKNFILNICSGCSFQVSFLKNKIKNKEYIKALSLCQFKEIFSTSYIELIGLKAPANFCYYYNKYMKIFIDI